MNETLRIFGTNQKHGQDYNKSVVFEHIRLFGPISRAQISDRTLLVPQTVSNLVKGLVDDGLVTEVQQTSGPRKRGATPALLQVNSSGLTAIGIQVQYSRIVAALVGVDGEILRSESRTWQLKDDFNQFTKVINYLVGELSDACRDLDPHSKIIGVGVGVPRLYEQMFGATGPPDGFAAEQGATGHPSMESLRESLESVLKLPVLVRNNANLAAIGEYWMGRGNAPRSFLYVYLGDNVGGGLIVDGNEYVGSNGRAVELGHVQYMPAGELCYCGARGCLDQYGSVNAIRRQLGLDNGASLLSVLESAQTKPDMLHVIEASVTALADSITSAIALFDIPACVLGGPHAKDLFPLLGPALLQKIGARMFDTSVLLSDFDINAGAIGAASTVFHDTLWCKPSTLLKGES